MKLVTTAKLPKKTSLKTADPDNPPWTEAMLGPAVLRRGRGPQKAPVKVLTSIRLDADLLAFFKAKGGGYQSRINQTLRRAVDGDLARAHKPARARAIA